MHFRPEFINRIDEFIVFQGLQREQIKRIVLLQASAARTARGMRVMPPPPGSRRPAAACLRAAGPAACGSARRLPGATEMQLAD